jgi:nucleolar protein 14
MKLRYIAEQRDRAKTHLRSNKKREKFNLDSDEEEGDVLLGGFTHKGKPLIDDFDDKISVSSDDDPERPDRGKLTEEMVNTLNFGSG